MLQKTYTNLAFCAFETPSKIILIKNPHKRYSQSNEESEQIKSLYFYTISSCIELS